MSPTRARVVSGVLLFAFVSALYGMASFSEGIALGTGSIISLPSVYDTIAIGPRATHTLAAFFGGALGGITRVFWLLHAAKGRPIEDLRHLVVPLMAGVVAVVVTGLYWEWIGNSTAQGNAISILSGFGWQTLIVRLSNAASTIGSAIVSVIRETVSTGRRRS